MPSLLALNSDWWTIYRDVDPVLNAIRQVDSEHFLPLVEQGLERNRTQRRSGPKSRTELAKCLARDEGNLSRKLNGNSEVTWSDMVSLAQLLEIPAGELFLPVDVRVRRAVLCLCNPPVVIEDATAYTLYRLGKPVRQSELLDRRCVQEATAAYPAGTPLLVVESGVNRVAERLEAPLMTASRKALKKRERR